MRWNLFDTISTYLLPHCIIKEYNNPLRAQYNRVTQLSVIPNVWVTELYIERTIYQSKISGENELPRSAGTNHKGKDSVDSPGLKKTVKQSAKKGQVHSKGKDGEVYSALTESNEEKKEAVEASVRAPSSPSSSARKGHSGNNGSGKDGVVDDYDDEGEEEEHVFICGMKFPATICYCIKVSP